MDLRGGGRCQAFNPGQMGLQVDTLPPHAEFIPGFKMLQILRLHVQIW